jgi:hypothetical protein
MPGVSVKFLWNCALIKRTTAALQVLMMAGLMSVAEPAIAANPPRNRVQILRVEHVLDTGAAAAWDSSLMSSRLPKFGDAAVSSPRELFTVCWEPTVAAPAGTLVTFEYLQESSRHIQFLFTKYEWPVDSEEKAVFAIDIGGTRPAGRVTAWRARVVYRGRLLAETTSDTWR